MYIWSHCIEKQMHDKISMVLLKDPLNEQSSWRGTSSAMSWLSRLIHNLTLHWVNSGLYHIKNTFYKSDTGMFDNIWHFFYFKEGVFGITPELNDATTIRDDAPNIRLIRDRSNIRWFPRGGARGLPLGYIKTLNRASEWGGGSGVPKKASSDIWTFP